MADVLHKDLIDADLHKPGYIQAGDPGAVGAGKMWIDTSDGSGSWKGKIRNAADTDWEEFGGGRIVVSDLKTILQMSPTATLIAFATTISSTDSTPVNRMYVSTGTAWRESTLPFDDRSTIDMGFNPINSLLGYEADSFTDKIGYNFAIGGSQRTTNGGLRIDVTQSPDTFEVRLRDQWNKIIYDFTIELGYFTHTPLSEAIKVWLGDSVSLGLNGIPIIQQYQVSMGAYPVPTPLSGGTF